MEYVIIQNVQFHMSILPLTVDRGSVPPGPAAIHSKRNTWRPTLIINGLTY